MTNRVNEFPVYHFHLSKERIQSAFGGRATGEKTVLQKRLVRKFIFKNGLVYRLVG